MADAQTDARPGDRIVLVVGDVTSHRIPLSFALQSMGIGVRVSPLGLEACAILDEPDVNVGLVLLNLTHPGPELDHTFKTLQVKRVPDHIPIWGVVLGDDEPPPVHREALADQGVTRFVDLGIEPHEIAAKVRSLLYRGDERRSDRRVTVYLPLEFRHAATQTHRGFITDLSQGGAFVQGYELYTPGAYLDLSFHLPGSLRELTPRARVRYVVQKAPDDPGYLRNGMGVSFEDIETRVRGEIAIFVQRVAEREDGSWR